jgi:predicted metal-dependent phosphoesterase TrpH
MRVGTLAITDHDTWRRFRRRAKKLPVPGWHSNWFRRRDFTVWENHEIHIVGLNIDIDIRRCGIFARTA